MLSSLSHWPPRPRAAGRLAAERPKRATRLRLALVLCCLLAAAGRPALGIVGGLDDDRDFRDPASPYYGFQWDFVYPLGSGSAVAISYYRLLTAGHYPINAAARPTLTINGDVFEVVASRAIEPASTWDFAPDLQVLELRNTTCAHRGLPGFYPLFAGPLEFLKDKPLIVVGTGTAGTVDADANGYRDDPASPRMRRWGTNSCDGPALVQTGSGESPELSGWSTLCFRMSFQADHTDHEAGYASGDSGGGVFVRSQGQWRLAGIGLYRDDGPLFRQLFAASIPQYADAIYATLTDGHLPGDTDLDGDVDAFDIQLLLAANSYGSGPGWSWEQGDFNRDGHVNWQDIGMIRSHGQYGQGVAAMLLALPEPTTACLLALGGLLLLGRKRRPALGGPRKPA
jgi:hypothetical protein